SAAAVIEFLKQTSAKCDAAVNDTNSDVRSRPLENLSVEKLISMERGRSFVFLESWAAVEPMIQMRSTGHIQIQPEWLPPRRRISAGDASDESKYILAYESHFVAAKHDDNGPQLNMGRRTHEFESFVDSVVEVVDDASSSLLSDDRGGKSVGSAAADLLELWQELQLQPQPRDILEIGENSADALTFPAQDSLLDDVLHHPQPYIPVCEVFHVQADNPDSEDDGFWDWRPDWFERLQNRFFFSFQYLKMLATTSRRMLRAVRDRRQWQGFESLRPLMGCAIFDIRLPSNVVGMYVGVRIAAIQTTVCELISDWTMVFGRPTRSMFNQFEFRPLVSPVQMTARLTCRICNREHPISLPRWSVCSFCDTWVCTTHVGQQPTGLCPCCPNQLLDYIGGSAGADPYVTAVNYFDERQQFEGTTEKNACVALKLFRKHESFLIANPLALQLLPDPRCRQELSKRTWEPLLFRARTIIDLLEQRKHVLLFRFLHAVANDRLKVHEALTGLPRPIGFHGTEDDWEQLALAHAKLKKPWIGLATKRLVILLNYNRLLPGADKTCAAFDAIFKGATEEDFVRAAAGNLDAAECLSDPVLDVAKQRARRPLPLRSEEKTLTGRKPYGFFTRMLRCVGWKRFEKNHIMAFRNIMERNFNSIFRRCLVWKPKPLFVDAAALSACYEDPEKDGIFEKDSTLRVFLESGTAIAASLLHQHGFEVQYTKEECRQMIEDAASDGLTKVKIREACGLPPQEDKFQKLQCQEDMAAELLELLESKLPAAEDTLSQQAGENVDVARASTCSRLLPQRRHKQKSSAKSEIRNPFSLQKMIVREVSYSYKSNVIRARKYAPEPSCQNLGNVFLAAVLSHTTDLDIENCCFSLLLQLLDFMKPVQKHWSAMRDILVDCAQNRSRVIANKLGLPQSQGKYLLMKLLNGGQENAAAVSFLSMAGMHSSSGCL
ncbi:unnamed protein product, partial [Symbiodinium microadriaticum]